MEKNVFFRMGTFLALALCLGPSRPSAAKVVDEISVVVDQDAMTKAEMEESIQEWLGEQGLPATTPPGSADYENAKKAVIDNFIKEVLLSEEADRQKIEIADGDIDHQVDQAVDNMKKGFASEQDFNDGLKKQGITLDDLKQDLHDKLLRRTKAARAMHMKQQELPATALVTDSDVQQYYRQHPTDFEQVKFSMILFRVESGMSEDKTKQVEALAQQALKAVKGGADFAQYAREHSEDKESAVNGGEIGTLTRASLEPKLANGVFALPVKGLGIVKAENGFYVVKVEYKGTADYASVAPEIKDHLEKQSQETALNQWIDTLKKDAYISVDGKVVPYVPQAVPSTPLGMASSTTTTSSSSGMTGGAVGTPSVTGTPPAMTGGSAPVTEETEVYSSLPAGGTWTFSFGAEGFNYGTQDLSNYYLPGTPTNQGFPYGFGLNLGMDFALDPNFQVGIQGEGIRKSSESVAVNGETDQWISSALGPSLQAKLLVPLDEGVNFILSGGAGYYFMFSSGVSIINPVGNENVLFSSSNWGFQGNGALEFMLDQDKSTALDIDGGYRYLRFTNIATDLTVSNGVEKFPSPLQNQSGSPAAIDFSGIRVGVSIRFYLDKESVN